MEPIATLEKSEKTNQRNLGVAEEEAVLSDAVGLIVVLDVFDSPTTQHYIIMIYESAPLLSLCFFLYFSKVIITNH